MTHLRLVPPTPSQIPCELELFAIGKFGDSIVIAHGGRVDLAVPGTPGFEAFRKWATEIEALAESREPLPWPLPKVPA